MSSDNTPHIAATIVNVDLDREELVIPVRVDELTSLQDFDIISTILLGAGSFFLSGATWLLVDKFFEDPLPVQTMLSCAFAMIFGGILLGIGCFFSYAESIQDR